jgi:hypothetical protein
MAESIRAGRPPRCVGQENPYVYAAEADRATAKCRSCIVVGGLGAAKTVDAIMKLPHAGVRNKLAEPPAPSHEIMLQIPMEPFDYPDNDPGPQTLLTSLAPEQNIDRLYWHLSRIQGYAGIANFMGARFLATDAVMQPILRDAAKRLDDGSTPRVARLPVAVAKPVERCRPRPNRCMLETRGADLGRRRDRQPAASCLCY